MDEYIAPAVIHWRDHQPYADQYQDIYFSKDGPQEVERVFLNPCGLTAPFPQRLTVAEIGFGSGLNFAVLAARVLQQQDAALHFISCDAHPWRYQDWQTMAANFPELQFIAELADFPPPLLRGWHRRSFADGRISLSVFHGDAAVAVEDLLLGQRQPINAWFLDGFTPAHNPDLWHTDLLGRISETCSSGTHIATFTAAGHVRRALQSVGFNMRRVDQRPHKRESLAGSFAPTGAHRRLLSADGGNSKPLTIYGAGIAGAMVARHLADEGLTCTVVDPRGIASGASAMRHTLMHGRLLGDRSVEAKLRSHAFNYASAYVSRWLGAPEGAYQIQGPNMTQKKMAKIADVYHAHEPDNWHWIEARTATAHPDLPDTACLWFATSRVVDLAELCHQLLDHPGICIASQPPATGRGTNILCTAGATRSFPGLDWLELADVGGQIDRFGFTATDSDAIVGRGYSVPTADGAVVGSTYEYEPWDPEQATLHNQAQSAALLPADIQWISRQRGIRSVTSDRIPLIGPVNADTWLCTGLGSMGTTYAPLAAAIVASVLGGKLPPVTPDILRAVDPMRIAERQARRGPRHR